MINSAKLFQGLFNKKKKHPEAPLPLQSSIQRFEGVGSQVWIVKPTQDKAGFYVETDTNLKQTLFAIGATRDDFIVMTNSQLSQFAQIIDGVMKMQKLEKSTD